MKVRFQPQGNFWYILVSDIPVEYNLYSKKYVARYVAKKNGVPEDVVYPAIRRMTLANGSKAYMIPSV